MVNFDQIVDLRRSHPARHGTTWLTAKEVRPTRTGHPDPFLFCPAVHLAAVSVLIEKGDQAGQDLAQLAGTRFVW
jgi:hypothetical protein